MNRDNLEGSFRSAIGQGEKIVGQATGDRATEGQGSYDDAVGKARSALGSAKDAVSEGVDAISAINLVSPICRGRARLTSRANVIQFPTAIIGLGIALWTLSAVRDRARSSRLASLTSPLRESSSSLVNSATKVFRERAEAKRREFVDAAQAQVATGAAKLSDEIERRLESVIDRVPGEIESPAAYRVHDSGRASVCARRSAVQTLTIGSRAAHLIQFDPSDVRRMCRGQRAARAADFASRIARARGSRRLCL